MYGRFTHKKEIKLSDKWDEYYRWCNELRDFERDCKIDFIEAVEDFEKVLSSFVDEEMAQLNKMCRYFLGNGYVMPSILSNKKRPKFLRYVLKNSV